MVHLNRVQLLPHRTAAYAADKETQGFMQLGQWGLMGSSRVVGLTPLYTRGRTLGAVHGSSPDDFGSPK